MDPHLETLRARLGRRRMPERGVSEREAMTAVGLGGPSPDRGRAEMPPLYSGMGVPTFGACGRTPYGLTATPAATEARIEPQHARSHRLRMKSAWQAYKGEEADKENSPSG